MGHTSRTMIAAAALVLLVVIAICTLELIARGRMPPGTAGAIGSKPTASEGPAAHAAPDRDGAALENAN